MGSKPEDIPRWLRAGFFICLGLSMVLVTTAPAFSWVEATRGGIRRVPPERSFANLRYNSRVTWLLRLIPYDPSTQQDLAVGRLLSLGPSSERYSFVASYHELRGYTVHDAVRMVGGSIRQNQHVTAVIFPVTTFDLTPANARGLLQVVTDIQGQLKLDQHLDISQLRDEAKSNLAIRESLASWAWDNYREYYGDFCNLAHKFRCGEYPERAYIGRIASDWNPLGFSKKTPSEGAECGTEKPKECEISDWDKAEQIYTKQFGARVFLIKNFQIKDLAGPYLIDFEQPDTQLIPDIGVPDPPPV